MYKRILVPPDGSRLAGLFGAELVLLMVLVPLPRPNMAGRKVVRSAEEASASLAQTYLEGIAAGLGTRGLSSQTDWSIQPGQGTVFGSSVPGN